MRVGAVNLASFANVLCHLNTTPLSVAVLAPCAGGENLAWQGVLNLAKHNTAWQNSMAQQSKRNEFSVASVCGRNKAWRHYKFSTEKMGQCLGGGRLSLSLSLSLLALFGTLKFLNALFLGFCALFVILSIATQRVARRKSLSF